MLWYFMIKPDENFDEIFATDEEGIYDYYDDVLIDFNVFKEYEDELLSIQLAHPEYEIPFDGFWSKESEDAIFKKFEEHFDKTFEYAKFKHRVDIYQNGYTYVMDEFLDMYPQFSDIFVGFVED